MFGVWQPGNHIGARIGGVFGTLTWSELLTTDTESAKAFYDGLFGWSAKTDAMGHYTEWMNQGRPIGGMMRIRPEWKGVPPHWMPYFLVADCDATAATAKELGGGITVPPMDVANVGRFAVLTDPQSAVFSVIRLTGPPT